MGYVRLKEVEKVKETDITTLLIFAKGSAGYVEIFFFSK